MRLNEPVRLRRRIGLTPLIDVVFLLLVFFMLASTFLKFGTVRLETAGAGGAVTDPSRLVLVHVAANRQFRVDGADVTLAALADAVNTRIDRGARHAVVVVRRAATVDDLVAALRMIRASRAQSVRVVE